MNLSSKINFGGVGDKDVYNITAPFIHRGETLIAGRVESRDEELSEIILFSEADNEWNPLSMTQQGTVTHPTGYGQLNSAQTFPGLQDPCVTKIDGKTLIGGVRFPVVIGNDTHAWQMEFYLEADDGCFEKVLTGPPKMKDIRFAQLPDSRIIILTRPQGERGGRGKIGYTIVNSLSEVTDALFEDAPLFDLCPTEEWVGGNEIHPLSDGSIGVLGHIAHFDSDENRHYYAMAFSFNPETGEHTPCKIIGRRNDFPAGDSKRPDLIDVIFAGGLIREPGKSARLYAGLSDAEAGWVDIEDPFETK